MRVSFQKLFFVIGSSLFVWMQPTSVGAALVPCGIGDGPACTLCHIIVGGKGLIDWGMSIMVIVGIALITIAGIRYVVSIGRSGEMGAAKGMIGKTLGGIALLLTGWLIVNVIITVLANDNLGIGIQKENWYKFSCDAKSAIEASAEGAILSRGSDSKQIACENADTMKSRLSSGGGVCVGVCQRNACSFSGPVDIAIREAKLPNGISRNLLAAVICQESSGRASATNTRGSFTSCGLMQVNSNEVGNTTCTDKVNLFDPKINIEKGLEILSKKFSSVSAEKYKTVSKTNQALAAYNCCGNGENPNTESVSCKANDGWESVPRWACPIDPGGMCVVREYACDVALCEGQYSY